MSSLKGGTSVAETGASGGLSFVTGAEGAAGGGFSMVAQALMSAAVSRMRNRFRIEIIQ
jgi:hypothetical protein